MAGSTAGGEGAKEANDAKKVLGVGAPFRSFSLFRSDYTLLKLLVLPGFRCSHLFANQ